jgi:multidrug resistance efflux pump
VHKGDVVCKLESSEIERKIEQAQLDLQKAEADLTAARESKEIQDSTNRGEPGSGQRRIDPRALDLQQYVEGTYPSDRQERADGRSRCRRSRSRTRKTTSRRRARCSARVRHVGRREEGGAGAAHGPERPRQAVHRLMVLEKYTHEKE